MGKAIKRLQIAYHYKDLLVQLVSRDLKNKYRRSFLGYLWSILNPLLTMTVMAIVFTQMFKRNIENYPVYLLTGQVMFNYMNQTTHQALTSITGNGALLKKTYLPKYIFTVSKITSGFVDFVLSLGALLIVVVFTKAHITWHVIFFPVVALELYIFCIGLGLFLSQAAVYFRDIQYIYNAVTTAWMYLTPMFYTIDMLPANLQWAMKRFNPMYIYITQFRDIVLNHQLPGHLLILAGIGYDIIFLGIGIWSFAKSQDKFILYI